jgi:hypothetical protein
VAGCGHKGNQLRTGKCFHKRCLISLIDFFLRKPQSVKHGRPIIVVIAMEEYERAEIAGDHPGGKAEGEHMSRSRPGSE